MPPAWDRFQEAIAAFILWLRGVGLGDRLLPADKGQGEGKSPVKGDQDAGPSRDAAKTPTQALTPPSRTGTLANAPVHPAAIEAAIAAAARAPAAPPAEAEAPPSSKAWLSALLEDHGLQGDEAGPAEGQTGSPTPMAPGAIPGQQGGPPLDPGQRLAMLDLKGKPTPEDLFALRNFPPGQPPPGTPEYRELLHAQFDLAKLHLLQRLADEPLFAYACRQWKPGPANRVANLEIVYALHTRLGKLMGSIFDFDPAPLADTAMPRNLHACYDEGARTLHLGAKHLNGPLSDLMDALAHQQTHAFQHHLILRAGGEGRPLPEPLQPFAEVWAADFKRWGQSCRPLAIGYHAYDMGRSVGLVMADLARREVEGV